MRKALHTTSCDKMGEVSLQDGDPPFVLCPQMSDFELRMTCLGYRI